jgi:hypothetical protein
MPPSSSPVILDRPIRSMGGSAARPSPLRRVCFAAAILIAAGCSAAPDPALAPPAAPAPPPPSAPSPPPETPPPAGQPVALCVLEDGEIAMVEGLVHPETGDTLIGGRPWREVHREDAPPYAAGADWYVRNEMMPIPGREAALGKYGLPRILAPGEVERYGTYRDLPVFMETGVREAIANVVYVFVRPGCEFQTYLQAYTIGAVRG